VSYTHGWSLAAPGWWGSQVMDARSPPLRPERRVGRAAEVVDEAQASGPPAALQGAAAAAAHLAVGNSLCIGSGRPHGSDSSMVAANGDRTASTSALLGRPARRARSGRVCK